MNRILCFIVFMAIIISAKAQVQELVSCAGDFFQTPQISISWSLGEPMTETFTGSDIILTQGFQQGIMDLVGVPDGNLYSSFKIEAYPNPTDGKVFIKKGNSQDLGTTTEFNYSILNLQGELLKIGTIDITDSFVDFSSLNQAAYLLVVIAKNQDFKANILITKL
jgi:hypothetical protein